MHQLHHGLPDLLLHQRHPGLGPRRDAGHLDPTLGGIAWFLYNSDGGTHPVRSLAPNALGLFDMSGNVWEWAHDGYAELGDAPVVDPVGAPHPDGLRVMRGGSYNCLPWENAGAHRSGLPGTISGLNVGARCARTLPLE